MAALRAAVEAGMNREQLGRMLPPGSARNALDCALWRLEAAQRGQTLWQLTGRTPPASGAIRCAETLSLGPVESMASAAAEAVGRGVQLLKIKLDREQILEKVAAVRASAPRATLIIDANEAWAGVDLASLFAALQSYGIAMIEQPLPAGQDADLLRCVHPIPVCADESCHSAEDIAGLRGRYDMINIKLDKCGGLTEALAMVAEAQFQGLRVMVGCMLGSSLAMEAALPVAIDAEYVDLDGPLWLAQDSAPHLHYGQGQVSWLPLAGAARLSAATGGALP